jgi:hypothetical protein
MADDGDQITLTASFDTQNAEAVLGVVEGDAVDQAGQNLGWRSRLGWLHHLRMMNRKIRPRYRDRSWMPFKLGRAALLGRGP